jgi:thioredoxin 1
MRIVSLFALLLLLSCGTSNKSVALEPDEFNRKMAENNVQILDVRTQEEYDLSHLANAVNIDIRKPDFDRNSAALYKDIPVYVYCKSGKRSSDAAEKLRTLGFGQVVEMKGGIEDWQKKGFPVVATKPKGESDFKKAIKGDKLVMVDFNAVWCKPCKMMEPFVKNIEMARSSEVTVFSIDTDMEQALAIEYGISQLPTFMFFRNGKILDKVIGYMEEAKLNELVDKYK